VTVNGKEAAVREGTLLSDYLAENGHELGSVAVERNGVILHKDSFASAVLSDGDTLEIVAFVGGG